jgi:hypothetical protein
MEIRLIGKEWSWHGGFTEGVYPVTLPFGVYGFAREHRVAVTPSSSDLQRLHAIRFGSSTSGAWITSSAGAGASAGGDGDGDGDGASPSWRVSPSRRVGMRVQVGTVPPTYVHTYRWTATHRHAVLSAASAGGIVLHQAN